MIRYVTKNDEGQILSLMELVKDDFAGYKEKKFLGAVYNATSNDGAIMEEKDGRIAGLLLGSKKKNCLFLPCILSIERTVLQLKKSWCSNCATVCCTIRKHLCRIKLVRTKRLSLEHFILGGGFADKIPFLV